ncbi:hypothetical protein ABPG72_017067 [Tetrahymena utriculariae]
MSKISNSSEDLPAVDFNHLKNFESRINSAISEFEEKQCTGQSYQVIKNIQQEVDQYFLMNEKPDSKEFIDLMTQICTKLNENPIVDSINEQFQRKPSQKYSSYTNYINQPTQDIDIDEEIQVESFVHYKNHQVRYQELDNLQELNLAKSQSSRQSNLQQKLQQLNSNSININTPAAVEPVSTKSDFVIHMENANSHIKDIEELLDSRKILAANRKVLKIEQILSECHELDLSDEQKKTIAEFKEKNFKLIEIIKDETDLINYNLEVLQVEEGWITEKEKGKIKISYQYPDSNSLSLRMESELDIPLRNLLCLGNEFEYFKDYVPFVEEGKLVKDIRRASKVGYACMDVPMVSKRECYFYGTGYNLLDEIGSIPLVSKSIHSDPEFCRKIDLQIPQQTKYVRLEYKYYVFNIIPLGPNKCYVKIVLNVDYKIPLVPKSIQNWCARKFSLYFFEKIIKKATNFQGTNWEKAMIKNKEFYDWLESQIQEFLKNCDLTDNSNTLQKAKEKIAIYLQKKKQEQQQDV